MKTVEYDSREKIGKKITFKVNDYKVEYGTVNSKDPKCVYAVLGGYIKPDEGYDLNREINQFKKNFKVFLRDAVHQLFGEFVDTKMPIISIVEVSDTENTTNASRINNVYTYFSIDITVYLTHKLDVRDSFAHDCFHLLFLAIFDFLGETRNLNFSPTRLK